MTVRYQTFFRKTAIFDFAFCVYSFFSIYCFSLTTLSVFGTGFEVLRRIGAFATTKKFNIKKYFNLHWIGEGKEILGKLSKVLARKFGFGKFSNEFRRWYWDSGLRIPTLELRHWEILHTSSGGGSGIVDKVSRHLSYSSGEVYKSFGGILE